MTPGRVLRPGTQLRTMVPSSTGSSYDNWTREELVARLIKLDHPKGSFAHTTSSVATKSFNFASHSLRKIALKFCYSGWEYNGLAFQNGPTPLPTVEEVLFDALARTRLVDPEGGLEGCGWERCGRTDRGVSAMGQVVSLYVRSALMKDTHEVNGNGMQSGGRAEVEHQGMNTDEPELEGGFNSIDGFPASSTHVLNGKASSRRPELRYVSILNRVLPRTIRVLAWSPVSPDFSARFACQHRHYKYFFSPYGLDISLMQNAASRLVGEHDFRNLCKLDATKQITNFNRRVLRADIGPVEDNHKIHVFDLVGTAFLYHQVRHIMAILFLVGTGLEHPSVMSALLNVDPKHPVKAVEGDPILGVVDKKPEYQMADALPLTLWDCAYADSDIRWRIDDDSDIQGQGEARAGTGTDLYHQLDSVHVRSVIQTTLEAHFLAAAAQFHSSPLTYFPLSQTGLTPSVKSDGQGVMNVPLGGGTFRRTAKYVPLLMRKRLDSVEVINERWRVGKGSRKGGKLDLAAGQPYEDDDLALDRAAHCRVPCSQ